MIGTTDDEVVATVPAGGVVTVPGGGVVMVGGAETAVMTGMVGDVAGAVRAGGGIRDVTGGEGREVRPGGGITDMTGEGREVRPVVVQTALVLVGVDERKAAALLRTLETALGLAGVDERKAAALLRTLETALVLVGAEERRAAALLRTLLETWECLRSGLLLRLAQGGESMCPPGGVAGSVYLLGGVASTPSLGVACSGGERALGLEGVGERRAAALVRTLETALGSPGLGERRAAALLRTHMP